MASAERKSVR